MKEKYWQLVNHEESDSADLYIFAEIADSNCKGPDDKCASDIVTELAKVSAKNLTVHINSYGGDVKEGLAIYNALKNFKNSVTTIDDGFACSAASVIFMAGKSRVMNDASLLMIHNPYMCTMGNPDELRKAADDLEVIAEASVNAYANASNLSEERIRELMKAETWILPKDALDWGMATAILEHEKSEDEVQQSAMPMIQKALASRTESDAAEKLEALDRKLEALDRKLDLVASYLTPSKNKTGFNYFFK